MKNRRSKLDYIRYYFNSISEKSHNILFKVLTALSFLMLFFYFTYILYYATVEYNPMRAIVGCASLCTMVYLNRSL